MARFKTFAGNWKLLQFINPILGADGGIGELKTSFLGLLIPTGPTRPTIRN